MVKNRSLSYELGRRLDKGPRATVPQAVHGKSATGNKHTSKPKQDNETLNIIQLNICGIKNKKVEVSKMLKDSGAHILLLQESLHQSCDPHISGFTHYSCKCNNCRGVITYIRNDVQGVVENMPHSKPTDIQNITIFFGGSQYKILNIYNPPANNMNTIYLNCPHWNKTLLIGDFNGQSPQWGYSNYNNTGRAIEELCDTTNLCILQDAQTEPTLLHRAHNTLSRPDLTIVSGDLLNKTSISVLDDVGSDHKPILTQISSGHRKEFVRKTRWNFKKANWEAFRTTLDEKLSEQTIETSVEEINQALTIAILDAASTNIPRGCRKKYKPFWNAQIEDAVNKRKEARKQNEKDPSIENKIQYNKACAKAKLTIKEAKRKKWTDTCAALDLKQCGKKAWALLNNLNNETPKQNPKPMSTPEGILKTDQKKANAFNKHFAKINKIHDLNNCDKENIKNLKRKEKTPTASASLFQEDFSLAELNRAIRKLKTRKSPGPDKIHNEMLLQLSPMGKKHLLYLINKSWQTGAVPKSWKHSIITPILKKDKPPEEMKSYRPISLTSCICKVAERMINSRLYWWMENSGLLNAHQAGFRSGQRTEDQLFRLTQKIIDGFQQNQHTVAVFVDLQQAYDRVWRKGLFMKMTEAGIHGKLYNWIKDFLSNRTISTKINNSISSKEVQEEGLPQGSCLSCTLFLLFVNDLPDILQTEKALYADDLAMWYSTKHLPIAKNRLNEDLYSLNKYCEQWKLKINCTKTVYTIFTNSPKISKVELNLKVGEERLTKEKNPSYLGVQLDQHMTLNHHMQKIKKKCTRRLQLVKRLASTTWGADKNTLRQLYLGYVRSAMEYCLPLQCICSKTTRNALDKVQNNAVRHISGGMRSTPIAACEIHTNIEPLDIRREAAVMEMAERYKRLPQEHPNKQLVDQWKQCTRLKKQSVLSFEKEIEGKYHLPQNRERINPLKTPPTGNRHQPTICLNLLNATAKKGNNPKHLMETAESTIKQYPTDWIHIYTDGSAHKGSVNAGYGALIKFPDNTTEELFNPCGKFCSNFEAEAVAMEASIRHLSSIFTLCPEKTKNVLLLTDSRSVLEALAAENLDNTSVASLAGAIDQFLSSHTSSLVLQWIPSHTNIKGNEQADQLAKLGASLPQPNPPVSLQAAKQIIRANKREEWMNRWAQGKTGRCVFPHMTHPTKTDNINDLTRHQQVSIFRLRTQHTTLNHHLSKITSDTNPACPLCKHPSETVTHHLFECQTLEDLRRDLLPPRPDIHNTLYTNKHQLIRTHTFFTMAKDRRTKAQPVAGSAKKKKKENPRRSHALSACTQLLPQPVANT